ncbi:hypothetical protein GCM10010214_47900 [Streptomyces abikoensis]|nr:hypothetical protein GCM10010214_47900 [Streptomyces abikoensis]
MLAPESYFFFRSAASFSRAAPVTRLPFFRVSATRASSWEMRLLSLMITPRRPPGHPFGKVHKKSKGTDVRVFRPRQALEQAIPHDPARTAVRVAGRIGRSDRAPPRAARTAPGIPHSACAGATDRDGVRAALTQMVDHASAE